MFLIILLNCRVTSAIALQICKRFTGDPPDIFVATPTDAGKKKKRKKEYYYEKEANEKRMTKLHNRCIFCITSWRVFQPRRYCVTGIKRMKK